MPPPRPRPERGLSPDLHLSQNRLTGVRVPKSAGVLRDQQILGETTGTHEHLLRWGQMTAGKAFGSG